MTNNDELRSRLGALAETVEPSDLTVDSVRARGRRRSRDRRILAIVGLSMLVVGTSIVVRVAGSDGDEPDVAIAADDLDAPDDGSADGALLDSTRPDESDAPTPTAGATSSLFAEASTIAISRDFGGGPDWVVPWGDGFLAMSNVYEPPPLPTADSELAGFFSAEILDALEAGGATTLEDAQIVLAEAGLLEEATEIVQDNPEVFESLFGGQGTTTFVSRISDNGTDWSDIDLSLPGDGFSFSNLQSDGTHLLIAQQTWSEENLTDLSVSFTTRSLHVDHGLHPDRRRCRTPRRSKNPDKPQRSHDRPRRMARGSAGVELVRPLLCAAR